MGLQKLISNLSCYNAWANHTLALWLTTHANEDKDVLTREVKSSFSSIQLTVQHITIAQRFWFQFVHAGNPIHFDWSINIESPSTSLRAVSEISQLMKDEFVEYDQEYLEEKIDLDQPWLRNSLPRYEYIMHVLNHSTYHRGQIITITRGFGVFDNIPNTDYNFYLSTIH